MKLYCIGIGPGGAEQMTLRAVRALEALHRRGVLLFIATGRASSEIPASVRALDARLPFDGFLTFNGQYCYDAEGTAYRDCPIDPEDVRRIVELAERGVLDVAVMQRSGQFVSGHSPRVVESERNVDSPMPEKDLRLALADVFAVLADDDARTDSHTGLRTHTLCTPVTVTEEVIEDVARRTDNLVATVLGRLDMNHGMERQFGCLCQVDRLCLRGAHGSQFYIRIR